MLLLLSLLLKAPANMAILDLQRHIPAADTNALTRVVAFGVRLRFARLDDLRVFDDDKRVQRIAFVHTALYI